MSFSKKLLPLAVSAAISAPALFATSSVQAGELSGNIGVHSKYLLRGIGQENKRAAVQGGLDYSNGNFYAGWWVSSLSYSDADADDGQGFENDFYGGFTGKIGGFDWDLGLIQYAYLNVSNSNLTELKAALSIGVVTAQLQYLLNDGAWGNAGDIYWTFNYGTDIGNGFNLGASLGFYTYKKDAGNLSTTKSSAFRHLNVTLSHPIGKTGADMYVQYTFAGKDRTGTDYDNQMVAGITYGFDIK